MICRKFNIISLFAIRKIAFVAIFGLFAAASAQEVELECQFLTTIFGEYACLISDAELSLAQREANVTVTGQHLAGRTNDDVDILAIYDSAVEFLPAILFTTFPNINEIDIEDAGLRELDQLPVLPNLIIFTLFGNNVSTIWNNTFINVAESLLEIDLVLNNHEILEAEALTGLENLLFLLMFYNELPYPEPGTFDTLINLLYLDFDTNNFGFIGEELFAENRNLIILFAERNGIDRIAPRFAANFEELGYFNAVGNVFINRGFDLDDDVVTAFMNAALQNCYNNFVGNDANSTRTVSFEYRGSLRLFDEFGNLILAAN